MTLERVESVTTFTTDNQVTTTTTRGGRHQRPSSLSYYIDEDRGYSTIPRNSPTKSPDLGFATASEDPLCRTVSQQSFLRTTSTRVIPSSDDVSGSRLHHRDLNLNHRSRHQQRDHHHQHSHHHLHHHHHHHHKGGPISHAVSTPVCNSTFNQSSSSSIPHRSKTPSSDIHNNPSSSSHHKPSSSHNHRVSNGDCQRSRYRKHEKSSKHTPSSTSNHRSHHHHRESTLEFPSVQKSRSESELCVSNRENINPNPNHQTERPVRRNHSTHSSFRPSPDCTGNPVTITTTSTASGTKRPHQHQEHHPHRRYSSSPESPKHSKACALSYVFPWSQKNNRQRRQRSPPASSSTSRDRCRRQLDLKLQTQTNTSQNARTSSSIRPLSIPRTNTEENFARSSHLSPDSDFPLTPKSAPVKSPFRYTAPVTPTEPDFPITPKSAPAFRSKFVFPQEDDNNIGDEEEEEAEEDLHYRRQHRLSHHHSQHQQHYKATSRSRSEQRFYHKSAATPVIRDKSEDAFHRDSASEDLNTTSKSLGDSTRKSLRDSNNRLYNSNNNNNTRSNHSSTYVNRDRERERDRERDHHRAVSSSGTTSERTKSQKSRRATSRGADHTTEEDSQQGQTTEESSTDCSRKNSRASVKPVDLDPKVDSFGRYVPVSDVDTKVINDSEDFVYRPTDMKGPLHLSFCGCGFLGMYHLGVVNALIQRGPSFLERVRKYGGASAGALIAALLVTAPEKAEESMVHFQNLSKEIRSKTLGALTPGYSLAKSLGCMLDDVLPEEAHREASGRLFVSLTNGSTKKNEVWSHFESREELMEVLIASCYIPFYAGSRLPTVRGKRYMDGGLSNNLLQFDSGRTITVSPFDGKSDIGPRTGQEASSKKAHFVNMQNQNLQINFQNIKRGAHAFFPPRRPVLQQYFDKGRLDASRFLIKEGLYEIEVQQQTQSVVYESSV